MGAGENGGAGQANRGDRRGARVWKLAMRWMGGIGNSGSSWVLGDSVRAGPIGEEENARQRGRIRKRQRICGRPATAGAGETDFGAASFPDRGFLAGISSRWGTRDGAALPSQNSTGNFGKRSRPQAGQNFSEKLGGRGRGRKTAQTQIPAGTRRLKVRRGGFNNAGSADRTLKAADCGLRRAGVGQKSRT